MQFLNKIVIVFPLNHFAGPIRMSVAIDRVSGL